MRTTIRLSSSSKKSGQFSNLSDLNNENDININTFVGVKLFNEK